ncbi:NAD(P)-dependent oxidoreductase [uncultured Phenylobacterium sp.]|uniref:NAD-dependent epimerase/dehydratase family protein n=1 Tax=uncultured Phenylobacterium sp. TaxID=349273 RepID=UPI0025F795A5|nr:NAD-dependent epimerase/dehydratase family protein [uncultured Phenylobacterium sp.]
MTTRIQRVLLTGATGFVGPHLVLALQRAFGEGLQIISASPGSEQQAGTSPARLDLQTPGAAAALVEAVRPDACLHLAGVSHVSHVLRNPEAAWSINLRGTLELADALQACAPQAPLIHISTAEVYGLTANGVDRLTEDSRLAPANLYGVTKAAADLALGERALNGLRVVRLRPFNHTGPGQSADFVIPHIARQIAMAEARGGGEVVIGALDRARDFLDVRDVCAAYVAALQRFDTLPPGAILNLASGISRTIGDVLQDMLRLARVPIMVRQEEARLRPHDVNCVCADAQRACAALEWTPTIAWADTLLSVLDDWRGREIVA